MPTAFPGAALSPRPRLGGIARRGASPRHRPADPRGTPGTGRGLRRRERAEPAARFPTPLCTAGTEPRTHTHTHTETPPCSLGAAAARCCTHTRTHTHTDIQPVPSLNAFSAALRCPPSILFLSLPPSLLLTSLPPLPLNPPAFCCFVFFSFLFFLFPPLRASLQSRHFDAISPRCGLKHKRSALPTPARLRAVGAQRSREGLRRFVPSGAGLLPSAQLQHPQPARSGDGGGRGGGRQEEGRAGERQAGRGGCEERRLGTSAHALCHRSPAAAGVSPLGPGG